MLHNRLAIAKSHKPSHQLLMGWRSGFQGSRTRFHRTHALQHVAASSLGWTWLFFIQMNNSWAIGQGLVSPSLTPHAFDVSQFQSQTSPHTAHTDKSAHACVCTRTCIEGVEVGVCVRCTYSSYDHNIPFPSQAFPGTSHWGYCKREVNGQCRFLVVT